jgi:hypothetical protein
MSTTATLPFPITRRAATSARADEPVAIGVGRDCRGEHDRGALALYADRAGRIREVVVRLGLNGSRLVVDRDLATLGDPRLVAHLAADEPSGNEALVCRVYLDQMRRGGSRCRRVTRADFHTTPFADADGECSQGAEARLSDRLGRVYALEAVRGGMSIPELRWRRRSLAPATVSVRGVIAALESYEPVRAVTKRALALEHRVVSTAVLRSELSRVEQSPIVLNRGLREATLACIEREGLSLSEVAIRCGRVKRNRAGGESGETSWLARRLGMLPEGGKHAPTPWIHTDVLALIARDGLGLSPREVEVG